MLDRDDCEFVMQALVGSIAYDYATRRGEVLMPELSCTDMHQAIEFFKSIDPLVSSIVCLNEGVLDIEYRLLDGEWISISYTNGTVNRSVNHAQK